MKRVKTVNEALSAVGLYFDGTKQASGYVLRDGRLFPCGDRVEPYKPPGEMFLTFAALSSEQEILNFATRFGLLAMPSYRPAAAAADTGDYAAESLSDWRAAIAQMRLAVALVERETTEPVRVPKRVGHAYDLVVKFNQHLGHTRLEAILVADNPPQFEMRLVPEDLRTFLWVQLLETLTTGNIIRRCIGCGELMLVSQRAGGHRANARSHPDRPSCRVRASQKFKARALSLLARHVSRQQIAEILEADGWKPALKPLDQIKEWAKSPRAAMTPLDQRTEALPRIKSKVLGRIKPGVIDRLLGSISHGCEALTDVLENGVANDSADYLQRVKVIRRMVAEMEKVPVSKTGKAAKRARRQ